MPTYSSSACIDIKTHENICRGTAQLYNSMVEQGLPTDWTPQRVFKFIQNETITGRGLDLYGPIYKSQLNSAIRTYCSFKDKFYPAKSLDTSLDQASQEFIGLLTDQAWFVLKTIQEE